MFPIQQLRQRLRIGRRTHSREHPLKKFGALAFSAALCLTSVSAEGKPASTASVGSDPYQPEYGLTGDWGGLRTRLHNAGLDISAGYVGEVGWNPAGGARREVTEAGEFDVGITLDAGRVAGIKGGRLQATATYRNGPDLGQKAGLNTLQLVQEVFGRGHALRLTQFWYQQESAGSAVSIKAGRAPVNEDFDSFSCYFMNLTFCGSQPGNLVTDYWFVWPISQWMARVKLSHRDFYTQAAVYQVNPRNLEEDFFGHTRGGTGVLVPVELGWSPRIGSRRLPGSYKVGGWYSDAQAEDVFLDINRQPRVVTGLAPLQRSSRYGFWINVSQQITGHAVNGTAVSGITVFLRLMQADQKTSIKDSQLTAGLFWHSPLKSLPGDSLALAIGRTNVNGRLVRGERLEAAKSDPLTAEYVAELYYDAHPRTWLELRPDCQYLHHAGGRRRSRNVLVLGLKAGIAL